MVASLVAWFSFDQVGDAQRQVNERAVPEIAIAFAVAQQSGTLAAAAPRLVAADTPRAFAEVAAKVAAERDDFKKQLAALTQQGAAEERFARIRARGDTLIANINAIEASVSKRFDLNARSRVLYNNLEALPKRTDRHLDSGHRRSTILRNDRLPHPRRTARTPRPAPFRGRTFSLSRSSRVAGRDHYGHAPADQCLQPVGRAPARAFTGALRLHSRRHRTKTRRARLRPLAQHARPDL